MMQQILITLGAGVASAVFFFIPVKGSMLAMFVGIFAPLPLMIVTTGYGLRAGVIASAVGVALIALVLHPYVAGAYLVSVAGPALALVAVAHMASPANADNSFPPYPLASLLMWIVGLTTLIDWIGIAFVGWSYESFDAALADLSARFAPLVAAVMERSGAFPAGASALDLASMIVMAMAPVMAVWGVLGLALNLWLAGRIVRISGQLPRPWPDIPLSLGLPQWSVLALALALCVALLPGVTRVFAATLAAALGGALALQGLAIVHYLTRGLGARTGLLFALYAVTLLLFPWPLIAAAGLGLSDFALALRARKSRLPTSTRKPEGD